MMKFLRPNEMVFWSFCKLIVYLSEKSTTNEMKEEGKRRTFQFHFFYLILVQTNKTKKRTIQKFQITT